MSKLTGLLNMWIIRHCAAALFWWCWWCRTYTVLTDMCASVPPQESVFAEGLSGIRLDAYDYSEMYLCVCTVCVSVWLSDGLISRWNRSSRYRTCPLSLWRKGPSRCLMWKRRRKKKRSTMERDNTQLKITQSDTHAHQTHEKTTVHRKAQSRKKTCAQTKLRGNHQTEQQQQLWTPLTNVHICFIIAHKECTEILSRRDTHVFLVSVWGRNSGAVVSTVA